MGVVLISAVFGCSFVAGELSRAEAQSAAIETGRVTSEAGEPLQGAVIRVVDRPGAMTLTDSAGSFRLERLSPGKAVLQAHLLGHESSAREILLVAGASTAVELKLYQAQISFSGGDLPLPSPELRAEALEILAEILAEPIVESFAREAGSSDVVMWIPWSPEPIDTVLGNERRILMQSRCESCAADTVSTIEAGVQYRAGLRHIRVGVTSRSIAQSLTLCLDDAEVGEVVALNCAQSRAPAR